MNEIFSILSQLEQSLLTISEGEISTPAISEQPNKSASLSHLIQSVVAEGTQHQSHTWAAHMTAPISSASLFGHLIAGLHNGNLLSPSLYPVVATIEKQLLSWFCQLFHQPYSHFTSGSTYGNLEALWQAKNNSTHSRVVYASKTAHYSIAKACQILDLELHLIDTDEYDQLIPAALEKACMAQRPLAIVATLGTSAAGAIDPIKQCCDIAQRFNVWCHIDAAWGGAMVLLPQFQSLFDNCGQADSICFDPHKGWQQPKACGVLLYKQALKPMLSAVNYLETQPVTTLAGSYGGEKFLPLWFDLMMNGVSQMRNRVLKRLEQATEFSAMLENMPCVEVYSSETAIVCFRLEPMVALDTLLEQGMLSKANIAGEEVYRAVFAHHQVNAERLFKEIEHYL